MIKIHGDGEIDVAMDDEVFRIHARVYAREVRDRETKRTGDEGECGQRGPLGWPVHWRTQIETPAPSAT